MRAEFANKMPSTARGEFKNFQLSTIRPEWPDNPIREYIHNLIAKFEDVIYNSSDLRRGNKDRLQRKFEFVARDLAIWHSHLVSTDCTDSPHPETWENDGEADETETCQAIDQIIDRMTKWSEVFLYSCRRASKGRDPMKFHDRAMGKVNRVADQAKTILNC